MASNIQVQPELDPPIAPATEVPDLRRRGRPGGALLGVGGLLLVVGGAFAASYFLHEGDAAAAGAGAVPRAIAPKAEVPGRLAGAVRSASEAFLARKVKLTFEGGELEKSWAELGLKVDETLVARETERLEKAGASPGDIKYGGESSVGLVPVAMDRAAAEPVLEKIKLKLDRGPENARLDLEKRVVHAEKPGFGIEVIASLSAIEAAAREGVDTLALEGTEIPATVTRETLGISDISKVLGHFQTTFPVAEKARNDNLKLVASRIDGLVLQPGQEFSFNKVVGDRTEKEGYKVAHVITAGEMVDGMAGGACQISTTLHGAVFFSGLDIVGTQPHSRPSTYVPLGFDATVAWPNVDFVFKNSFDFPVAISYKVARGVARAEILGKEKPFDKIEFVREVMEEKPFETITREDDTIGMGYMQIDQPGYPGYKLERHRLIYKGDKVVKKNKWVLNYKPVVEYVRMGVNPDPNLPKPADKKSHMPKPAKDVKFTMAQ